MKEIDKIIQDVQNAQIKLNNLLTSLYQHDLTYELSINNPCGIKNDTRRVVGIKVFNAVPVYKNDGVY